MAAAWATTLFGSCRRAEDRRPAGAEDAGLLPADGLDRVAQPFAVIEAHRDDGRGIRVEQVHGVQPSAHAHFEHGDVDAGTREHDERGQRVPFEEGQRHVAARGVDRGESREQFGVGNFAAVHADALVVAHEVRRREQARLVAGRREDRVEVGGHRTLAVRAADGQHRRRAGALRAAPRPRRPARGPGRSRPGARPAARRARPRPSGSALTSRWPMAGAAGSAAWRRCVRAGRGGRGSCRSPRGRAGTRCAGSPRAGSRARSAGSRAGPRTR